MIVMKFGGSSVGTAEAISQVAEIVVSYAQEEPVVVVSALQGITDRLLASAQSAAHGNVATVAEDLKALERRHLEVLLDLGVSPDEGGAIVGLVDELRQELADVASRRGLSDRSLDAVVSFGERLSALVVAAAFRRRGQSAVMVDARDLIETDDHFTCAGVDFVRTDAKTSAALLPLVESGIVPVVTGFIGATPDGATTTLGRGGSDYSATIIGGALGAREIWIWKEVDGVMTADPRTVPGASLLPEISYDEAAELSWFGAKVLHPKSMIPAVARRIPVRLRNTFRPDAPGTMIGERTSPAPLGVKAVTSIRKLAVITIEGKGMTGITGFAARVFAAAGRLRINILMFSQSSSEQDICLVTGAGDALALKRALEEELSATVASRDVDTIEVEGGMAVVAVIGEGMRGTPGTAARTFGAVAGEGISVLAIAQGSSERNISFVVPEADADRVVRAVHDAFHL